jgi:transposase
VATAIRSRRQTDLALALRTQFHEIKREQFPWVYEVTKCAVEGAFMDVAAAFKNFFEGRKAGRKTGYPHFKSKRRSRPSFYLANGKFTVGDRLPRRAKVGTSEYGGDLPLLWQVPLRTHLKNGCMVVCVHYGRNTR